MISDIRSTIAVNREIVAELSDVASKKKVTRYFLANAGLKTLLRVHAEGGDISDVYPSWKLVQLSREVGGFPLTPRYLMDAMAKRLFATDKKWLLRAWYEQGAVLGTILSLHYDDLDNLGSELFKVFPSMSRRIEVRPVERKEGVEYLVRVVGEYGEELAQCLGRFIQGVLSAYSLDAREVRISRNVVRMSFEPRKESKSQAV